MMHNKWKKYLLLLVFLLPAGIKGVLCGQEHVERKHDTLPDKFYILENRPYDTIWMPTIEIKEVAVQGDKGLFQWWKNWRYRRLVHNVKKVYPYAVIVRKRLVETMDTLQYISSEKEKRKYLKELEKEVFDEYETDMKHMSLIQGKLLIKLIDRETQNTSYSLIREYRNGVTAFFWQGIARLFGANLKSEYDPDGQDRNIERIVRKIEEGVI